MQKKYDKVTLNKKKFLELLPIKDINSYKNINGRSLIIGGSYGYAGACILNLKAALMTNNGYNTALIDESVYHIIGSQVYQCVYQFTNKYKLADILYNNDAILFGSGCVNMENKKLIFDQLIQFCKVPLVLDAEAFNLLEYNLFLLKYSRCPIIMTPHIGEFSRIMHIDVDTINKDRLNYAKKFVERYDITLVLKGPETIVINKEKYYINKTGNPVLAKAGSGDILSGLLVGYLSQIEDIFTACCLSVFLHGALADNSILNHATTTILPEDILKELDNYIKIV
jgi:NAD(P)H-hydrate epimerase